METDFNFLHFKLFEGGQFPDRIHKIKQFPFPCLEILLQTKRFLIVDSMFRFSITTDKIIRFTLYRSTETVFAQVFGWLSILEIIL